MPIFCKLFFKNSELTSNSVYGLSANGSLIEIYYPISAKVFSVYCFVIMYLDLFPSKIEYVSLPVRCWNTRYPSIYVKITVPFCFNSEIMSKTPYKLFMK